MKVALKKIALVVMVIVLLFSPKKTYQPESETGDVPLLITTDIASSSNSSNSSEAITEVSSSCESLEGVSEDSSNYKISQNPIRILGKAQPETIDVLTSCNKLTEDFFSKYNIDVSGQIDTIENIFIFEQNALEDVEGIIWGYVKSHNVYINKKILSDEDRLKFTYTHDVCHYLGFTDKKTIMLQEGMADAIAERILGYSYSNSYDISRILCHQILVADPDVIPYILNGGDLDDRIDERLKNLPTEWQTEEEKISDYIDSVLYQVEYHEQLGLNQITYISYINKCQSIIFDYCQTFELTEDQISELDSFILF